MGEKSYSVGHKYIVFEEMNEEFPCLCTFPHNDSEQLSIDRLKSLALFGAVVRLVFDGYYEYSGEYIYIPKDVPDWIISAVRNIDYSLWKR